MCWGFSCSGGWFFLINYLCHRIQRHIDGHNEWVEKYAKKENPIPQVVVQQVKEKFGGLRFYYSGGDEKIAGMVDLAENMSYHICEKCGVMNGTVTVNGGTWIRALCPNCRDPKDMAGEKSFLYHACDNEVLKVWQEAKANPEDENQKMKEAMVFIDKIEKEDKKAKKLSALDLIMGEGAEERKE
jgi:hypothetical protein